MIDEKLKEAALEIRFRLEIGQLKPQVVGAIGSDHPDDIQIATDGFVDFLTEIINA